MWVAISQRMDMNAHGSKINNLEANYVKLFNEFDMNLIQIPNDPKNLERYFDDLPIQCIVLSGGNDIHPSYYDGEVMEGLNASLERDRTEEALLVMAIEKKLPVLGICRGMQFINVYFKGGLIVDIKESVGDEVSHVASDHEIFIADNGWIDLLGDRIMVNSYHNSGITKGTLSPELISFANAGDEVIEGFYHPTLPIVGIQWHPERESPDEIVNAKIIELILNNKGFWNI